VAAADIVKIDGVAIADVEKVDGATKPSAALNDWSASLWWDDNLTSDLGNWNDTAHTSDRELQNGSYTRNYIPYIDDSSGTKYLKILFVGDHFHTADDFIEMGSVGTRVLCGGSQQIVGQSDTGIAFDGSGDLIDGDHGLQIHMKHDTAKTDTFFRVTVVLTCSSNTIKVMHKWQSRGNSGGSFTSVADTLTGGDTQYEFSYVQATNTWTDEGPHSQGFWWGAFPGSQVSTQVNSDGDGFEKENTDWYVDGDSDDDLMWYVKTG